MGLAGAAALTAFSALSPNAFAAQVIQPGGGTSGYGYIVAVNTVYTQFGGVVGEFAIYGSDKFMAYQYPGTQIYPGWSGFFGPYLYSALVSAADEISGATLSNDIVQSDIVSDNSLNGNGYLGLPITEIDSVASELGGNAQFVENQVQPYEYKLYDTNGNVPTQYLVPFAYVASESGAEMDPSGGVVTPTGNYYGNDPIEHSTFYVIPSKPPTAQSLTAQVQGTNVTLTFNVNVPLWSSLANYHYDAVEITNLGTGQTEWLAGTGFSDISEMQNEVGSQGTYTDTFSASYLTPGNYEAQAWVADGVDRISGPVTANFTIGSSQSGSGGGVGTGSGNGVSVSLSAVPQQLTVGQYSTLTVNVNGTIQGPNQRSELPNGDHYIVELADADHGTTLAGSDTENLGNVTSYTQEVTSAQPYTAEYEAYVIDTSNGQTVVAQSTPVQVTWGQVQTQPTTGQCSQASWSVGSVGSNSAGLTFTHDDSDTYAFTVNNGGSLSVPGVGGSEQSVGVILTGQPGESYTVTATDTTTDCTVSTTVTLSANGSTPIQTGSVSAIVSDQYTQLMGGGAGIYAAGPNVTVDAGTSVNFNVQFLQTGQPAIYYSDFEAPNNGNLPAATNTGWSVTLVSNGGTGGASLNQTFYNGASTGTVSVSTQTPQTVTYTASLINPEGVMESSETFQITWAGATVSASPTQLPVGQVSTITVNANAPGRTVTLYSTAPVIQGEQPSETCTTKGCHSNGNYQITVNDTGTTTLQAVSNTAQVVKFWVTTTPPNPPSPTDVGQGTTSPTVTVAWGNNTGVSITLMATPGSTTYGGTITESYSVQGWQPGDEVIIQVVNESPATPAEASGTYFPNGWYSSGYCTASGCVYQAVLTEPSASHNESEQPVTLEAGIGGSVTDQGDTLTITYQAEVVNADGQLLATSNEITPTWVPPQSTTQPSPTPTPQPSPSPTPTPNPSSGVTLTLAANPTELPVGQATTLTVNVTSGWQNTGDMWITIVNETTGQTVGPGEIFTPSASETYTSNVPGTDTFIAYVSYIPPGGGVFDIQNDAYQSNPVSVTWTNGTTQPTPTPTPNPQPTPPPEPNCGSPYDSDEQWTSYGNGSEELTWVYNVPTPEYNAQTNSWQCVDVTTQESQYYPASVNDGQISGLSYDPGTPEDMWLPVPAGEWDSEQCPGLFCQYFQEHGFTGLEGGGPTANQISSTLDINGQTYHTYGPPIGDQTPTVWVRPDAGFGFRYVWQGPPNSLPTGGTVTFTMTNPDGGSITWTEPLTVNSDTLYDVGDTPNGTQAPEMASEVVSCWTNVPKGVYLDGKPELTAWSISSNPTVAYEDGAHISFVMTVDTPAGNITVTANNVACTFGWPAYWFTHIISESIGGKSY
ncbi:hypothetical protein [Alicyclobacillus acidocaldarius]|nr:hypothetical protein [Alicyclobacillus acidocaldarius]